MDCPKCGHDNPEKTLFCEGCDWRMDQPVRRETIPRLYSAATAIALGIVSVLLWYMEINYGAVGLGAVGMVMSSYSLTVGRRIGDRPNVTMVIVSGAALLTSVIGFIMGIGNL